MIAYLPEIYHDELVYSWFCRYYVHSGYLTHSAALKEILYKRCNNPSKEFLGHLNPDMLDTMRKMYPIRDLILNHTMFPQYARFVSAEQKRKALYKMETDFCDVNNLLSVPPRNKDDMYLRYCPVCAEEDKQCYGETYWHRVHQIRDMRICTKHGCYLINSQVTAKSEQTFTLCPAELYTQKQEPIIETDANKLSYAEYLTQVFEAPVDFENDIPIADILYHALKRSGYVSLTGKTRYTKKFTEDMNIFYSNMGLNDTVGMSQVQRVLLNGECRNFSTVCRMMYFAGVRGNEFV